MKQHADSGHDHRVAGSRTSDRVTALLPGEHVRWTGRRTILSKPTRAALIGLAILLLLGVAAAASGLLEAGFRASCVRSGAGCLKLAMQQLQPLFGLGDAAMNTGQLLVYPIGCLLFATALLLWREQPSTYAFTSLRAIESQGGRVVTQAGPCEIRIAEEPDAKVVSWQNRDPEQRPGRAWFGGRLLAVPGFYCPGSAARLHAIMVEWRDRRLAENAAAAQALAAGTLPASALHRFRSENHHLDFRAPRVWEAHAELRAPTAGRRTDTSSGSVHNSQHLRQREPVDNGISWNSMMLRISPHCCISFSQSPATTSERADTGLAGVLSTASIRETVQRDGRDWQRTQLLLPGNTSLHIDHQHFHTGPEKGCLELWQLVSSSVDVRIAALWPAGEHVLAKAVERVLDSLQVRT